MAGSPCSRGSPCKFTTWSLKGVVGTLGTYPGRCLRTMWESAGPNSKHESPTENACRSPTLLTEAKAVRSTVFNDRNFSSTDCRGSKGSSFKAVRTEWRFQESNRWGQGEFNLLHPWGTWWPSRASLQTCRLLHCDVRQHFQGGGILCSSSSCRNESTTKIGRLRGSSRQEKHQSVNRFHFSL